MSLLVTVKRNWTQKLQKVFSSLKFPTCWKYAWCLFSIFCSKLAPRTNCHHWCLQLCHQEKTPTLSLWICCCINFVGVVNQHSFSNFSEVMMMYNTLRIWPSVLITSLICIFLYCTPISFLNYFSFNPPVINLMRIYTEFIPYFLTYFWRSIALNLSMVHKWSIWMTESSLSW